MMHLNLGHFLSTLINACQVVGKFKMGAVEGACLRPSDRLSDPKNPPAFDDSACDACDDSAADVVRVPGDVLWCIGSPRWLRPNPDEEAVEEDTISVGCQSPQIRASPPERLKDGQFMRRIRHLTCGALHLNKK